MITGANGFVGRRPACTCMSMDFLCVYARRAWSLYETKPADNSESKSEISYHSLGDFTAQSDWSKASHKNIRGTRCSHPLCRAGARDERYRGRIRLLHFAQ